MFDVVLLNAGVVFWVGEFVTMSDAVMEAGEWVDSAPDRTAYILSAWGRVIDFVS